MKSARAFVAWVTSLFRINSRIQHLESANRTTSFCTDCRGIFIVTGIVTVTGVEGQFCRFCVQRHGAKVIQEKRRRAQ